MDAGTLKSEVGLRWCGASGLLVSLAGKRRLRDLCVSIGERFEGGDFYSGTLREILRRYYGVVVGAYSYGECLQPGRMPAGLTVGRYVSMAAGVRVFLRNHPMDWLSMHPFFFNAALGEVKEDTVSSGSLWVGHDAWIGERAIITPGCRRIGIGSVVGAGAVVTRDVPDFAVVVGNPAKVIKVRFPEPVCAAILASRWWEKPIEELRRDMASMTRPVVNGDVLHPLLKGVAPVGADA